MTIIETTNFTANITLKDAKGTDAIVAYLSSAINASTQNYNISMNVVNKVLLNTVGALNVAGETAKVQYADFELQIKTSAKALGYVLF